MKRWFTISNKAAAKGPVDVLIYGEIGGGWTGEGVEAKAFKEAFDAIPAGSDITLRIHSPGGSVFDGLAIYNTILARRSEVTAHVDGLAASAASFIAMAASRVVMPKTSRMMIHDAQGIAIGDSESMKEMAALLDRESDRIADIYAGKTGKDRSSMRALMRGTKWMDGNEAKDLGFADEVTDYASVKNDFDLSAFQPNPAAPDTEKPGPTNAYRETKNTMNRTQIIALLNKYGVTVDDKSTDEQLVALLEKTVGDINAKAATPPPAPTPDPVMLNRMAALEAQAKADREARITSEITALCADRQIEAKPFVALALTNEAEARTAINAVPLPVASDPINTRRVENNGNSLIDGYRALKPGQERLDFTVSNFEGLRGADLKTGRFNPRNLNTFDAALTPNVLADALIVVMTNRLAALSFYSRTVALAPMKPKTPIVVTLFSTGTAAQVNPTSFQSNNDSTLAPITVTPALISKMFHLTYDQMQSGFELRKVAEGSANLFADKISDQLTALMLTANYGTPLTVGAASAFTVAKLSPILAAAKDFPQRRLMLDFGHMAYILPSDKTKFIIGEPGAYGFDGGIVTQNRYTGATANTCGFVSSPDAIALGLGVPLDVPGGAVAGLQRSEIGVPQLGITALQHQWVDTSTRNLYASYDILIGAAVGDATQGKGLITA